MTRQDTLWYKDAIIYEVHIKCFFDSSGDGIGDFKGLTEKLDYLSDLGVTAIWLLPFYPSPLKDDGYDISNYQDVHYMYGSLSDFRYFLKEAHRRDLRVITELVINHTSDQHPWFQRARMAPKGSKWRDFYVWSDDPDKYKEARIIFQDFETSNWTWDSVAQSYYWHRFYSHQPDLNFENPHVQQAVFKALDFWLKMGVDGVRLDAIPYLYEEEGTTCENLPRTHKFLKKLRTHLDTHFKDRMFLAEANQWPEEAAQYFGQGDECHMAFHFPVMPRLFMSIHLEDALPIVEIMGQTPSIPENCQWALFLRNHDELTLEMVTDEERDYMWRVYAHDPKARINLGIRRRLAPLLKNDRRKIELMNSLLFSLIGTPVLYYGDEIGMGDNIYLGDRNGVRTPMQWSSDRNAGFSRVNPQALYLPPIIDPEYHFETVNVEAQQNNPHSLLWWTKQLISLRKKFAAFGKGATEFLVPENKKVLVFFRIYGDEHIMIVANLSRFSQYVELDLSSYKDYYLVELFSGGRFPAIGELPYFLTLGPYGYYWFSLHPISEQRAALRVHLERESRVEVVHIRDEHSSIYDRKNRKTWTEILYRYLCQKRWFVPLMKQVERSSIKIVDHFSLERGKALTLLELQLRTGSVQTYLLFTRLIVGDDIHHFLKNEPQNVVAHLQNSKKESIVLDISHLPELSTFFEELIAKKKKCKGERGTLLGISLQEGNEMCKEHSHPIACTEEHSNVFPSKQGMLRLFTMLEEGMPFDIAMRLHLEKHTSFTQFFPVTGYVEYSLPRGSKRGIAEELSYCDINYNAFNQAVDAVERFLIDMESMNEEQLDEVKQPLTHWSSTHIENFSSSLHSVMNGSVSEAKEIAKLLSRLHAALNTPTSDPAFQPLSFTLFYQRSLYQTLRRGLNQGLKYLKHLKAALPKILHSDLEYLFSKEEALKNYLHLLFKSRIHAHRIRYHGNFALEHLIFSQKEYKVANFHGNPNKSYSERCFKRSPLIDLATLLFSYQIVPSYAINRIMQRGQASDKREHALKKFGGLWSFWIQKVTIDAYYQASGCSSFLPQESEQRELLLNLFLLEGGFEVLRQGYAEGEILFEGTLTLVTNLVRQICES